MIWVAPGVVAVLLALPVVLAFRRCAADASALRRSLSELAELRVPVSALRLEVEAFAGEVPVALRRRSVVAAPARGELPAGR